MTQLKPDRVPLLGLAAFLLIVGLMGLGVMKAYSGGTSASPAADLGKQEEMGEKEKKGGGGEKYLFVWAGDQARTNPDFLAVVNLDDASADYGKIITTVPLQAPGATDNEPHHVGLSRDKKALACGGLLSVLKRQKEVFSFDGSNPVALQFISAVEPPPSASTVECYANHDGG